MVEIPVMLMNAKGDGAVGSGDTERLEAMEIDQYAANGNGENLSEKETLANLRYLEDGDNDNFPCDSLNSG